MVFATPDFGAGGCVLLVILAAYICVFVAAVAAAVKSYRLVGNESARKRWLGWLLLVLAVGVPLSCWFGPRQVGRLVHGRYPLDHYPSGVIQEGMTEDEVRALLGNPHRIDRRGEFATWFYHLDTIGLGYFAVDYGTSGRVERTFGD